MDNAKLRKNYKCTEGTDYYSRAGHDCYYEDNSGVIVALIVLIVVVITFIVIRYIRKKRKKKNIDLYELLDKQKEKVESEEKK